MEGLIILTPLRTLAEETFQPGGGGLAIIRVTVALERGPRTQSTVRVPFGLTEKPYGRDPWQRC